MTDRPSDASAAGYQNSDYSGVSTADLYLIQRALQQVPATLAVMAVGGRVRSEWGRRDDAEKIGVLDAYLRDVPTT